MKKKIIKLLDVLLTISIYNLLILLAIYGTVKMLPDHKFMFYCGFVIVVYHTFNSFVNMYRGITENENKVD